MANTSPLMRDNKDVAGYLLTKHSWRGKYRRIFSVGTDGITTYNPSNWEVTNQFPYREIGGVQPKVNPQIPNEFIILIKKAGHRLETMRFSAELRSDIITNALRYRNKFGDGSTLQSRAFPASKHHWSETMVDLILDVTPRSIDQRQKHTDRILCSYDYQDIEGFAIISDHPSAFVIYHGGFGRMHVFSCLEREELIKTAQGAATQNIGVFLKLKNPVPYISFINNRLGKFSDDACITSLAEFKVQKISIRSMKPQQRILCLTEMCLIERDIATYSIICCKALNEVFAIIRDVSQQQLFTIECMKSSCRQYLTTERDALLATLLDGVRSSGNRNVCVKMTPTDRGLRTTVFHQNIEGEVESYLLKNIITSTAPTFQDAIKRFNDNVSYSGLLHAVTADKLFAENKEKLICACITALISNEGDQNSISSVDMEEQFLAIRRLVASKAGFQAFTNLPEFREKIGKKVIKALRRGDDGLTHAAIETLCALMQPMHDDYDLRQEQLNKTAILASDKFLDNLLSLLTIHVNRGTGALVISSLLDFLTFALCAPYSETTDGSTFDNLLGKVAALGRVIFKLFQHSSMAIVKSAGMLMRALIEEGDEDTARSMQQLALAEGALIQHIYAAFFTTSNESRSLANRQLSRYLIALWITGNANALNLLKRILPAGLVAFLDSTEKPPTNESALVNLRKNNLELAMSQSRSGTPHASMQQIESFLTHWKSRVGSQQAQKSKELQNPIVLRRRRQRVKANDNWSMLFYQFNQDHMMSNLIWNHKTREELRSKLELEISMLAEDRELIGGAQVLSWNHNEFEVRYECLADEIRIGDYFLRVLLERGDTEELLIRRPTEFFNDLYHRFLLSTKSPMRCMCLQAMSIVYKHCHELIGPFNDTAFVIGMLERCFNLEERDRLVIFINQLILNEKNVRILLDANGIKVLVDLLTLAHLHVSRAVVPLQLNVLEADPSHDAAADEKEWYITVAENTKTGPFSYAELKEMRAKDEINIGKSKFWAQGMDGWHSMKNIAQLRWYLLAEGTAVLNESQLAILILDIFLKISQYFPSRDGDDAIIRPLPKAKRILSNAINLPHLVQMLLTFEPAIVERVAILLLEIVQDNPNMSRFYLTGVFFFILMYTGSNVLPIAKLLKYLHLKQAFISEEKKTSDIMQCSILGPILPDAMVFFLENHGPEKFAQIFLGEYNTPEAIWGNQLRQSMIIRIAAHIAEFTPRLRSNTRAVYQYCPLPVIAYEGLEDELYVNIFYLKNLCDLTRFPDWPIQQPVHVLKDCLEEWKSEVQKTSTGLTHREALKTLQLDETISYTPNQLRKAYYDMARKYHTDINPKGREMFEDVVKAYEFLNSRKGKKASSGPDRNNIAMLLQTQSILFSRYGEELQPYKYAGYPMLIKSLQMEVADAALFSKEIPLLPAASELCFHTVNCSSLNAEELRREGGLEILSEALDLCVNILGSSSNSKDMNVQVCRNVAKCYSVAALFGASREKLLEMPTIVKNLCRILFFKHLPSMCIDVTECVSAFAVDSSLQNQLLQAGVLWHLLLFLFNYDYTLEESGVEKSAESNQQEEINALARNSCVSLCMLTGTHGNEEIATPENEAISKCLLALLTPYLFKQLRRTSPHEFLKVLNSNTENPYLIWDNGTRAELIDYLEKNQQDIISTGECDQNFGSDFVFSSHSNELMIRDVYIRIYNEQNTFILEEPASLAQGLLEFLESEAQYLFSLIGMTQSLNKGSSRLSDVLLALRALKNVIVHNQGIESECNGHFKLLFSFLALFGLHQIQESTLENEVHLYSLVEVIATVVANKNCVNKIAETNVLGYLLLTFNTLPSGNGLILEAIQNLSSNSQIVREALSKGALLYILDLYCSHRDADIRERAAEVFGKLMSDKLVGPKVRIFLNKFLPPIFMDAMRDTPSAAVHMFEGVQENPELIWKDNTRKEVCNRVTELKKELYNLQKVNPDTTWRLPDNFAVVYAVTDANEAVVSGVYLRLYVAQPSWVLRRPREFMVDLLECFKNQTQERNVNEAFVDIVASSIVGFFANQPSFLDQVPPLGQIPIILKSLGSQTSCISIGALRIFHVLSGNELCVHSISTGNCITPLKKAMKTHADHLTTACEGLYKMFQFNESDLVKQALDADMVNFLLELLESGIRAKNPQSVRAHIVDALKAMAKDPEYGEQITELLNESAIWKQYKDQNHFLFMENINSHRALTGAPQTAGYLTQGQNSTSTNEPPPLVP